MKRAYFLLNLALVLSCLSTASANAATITWASGVSGNWSNPTNWSPNQVPGPADTAAITASGNYTVTVDTIVAVNALVLGSSDTTRQIVLLNSKSLGIRQSATLNTNGIIDMGGGFLYFDPYGGSILHGTLNCAGGTLEGVLTIASNGVANLATTSASAQTIDFTSLTVTNYGTVVWSNINLDCESGGQIYNYNLLSIQSDNTFTGSTSTVFNNFGTIRKNIGTYAPPNYVTSFNSTTLNNSGTVDVEMGGINFSGGNGGGFFHTATNAGLGLVNFTLTGDTTFTGPGQVQGTLYGQSGVIHGSMTFDSGSFSGTLAVATDGVVNLVGINGYTSPIGLNDLTLANYGTIVWSNIDLQCTDDSQIYNYNLLNIQSDNTFTGDSSTALNNYGTIRKNNGTFTPPNYITRFNTTTFNNSGTVDIEIGGINFLGGDGGGLFNTATNAGLSLGDFTLTGDSTFAGQGQVQGTLYGQSGIIHGSMAFDYGSFSGTLTVATDGVVNLVGIYGETTPIVLNGLSLTNCGTVVWSNLDLDCSSVQVYNYGLWDAQSDNTFNGNFGNSPYLSTFYNYGTVRKDGGSATSVFDGNTTFTNCGTVDVETAQLNLGAGYGGGVFNTASNAYLWLGYPGSFNLSGVATFTGPGLVWGNLYGTYPAGVIHGSLNFYYGSLGGFLTVAKSAVANLAYPGWQGQAITLNALTLTNCGTVVWSNLDLDCSSAQVYNYGLWDAQSDNTFNGNFGNSPYLSMFYNYGTVRKDGGSATTTFDGNTTFTNCGTVDVETAQLNLGAGYGGGVFNTASNAYLWLGYPGSFNLSGNATFTGPGLVWGNLYGIYPAGVIQGSLNFYSGSLGGFLTVAKNAVANLVFPGRQGPGITLSALTLTNCGTVVWNNVDLDCTSVRVYNFGLWDAQSDNTFYGNSGDSPYLSTFYNQGTVRKDGGIDITTFDGNTTFTNSGTVDVETAQITLGAGYGGGVFNTASNAYLWLGNPGSFNLSGVATFSGSGLVTGNLYGIYPAGVIQGSLNFYGGSLGGFLTVASNAVANLTATLYSSQAVDLVSLTLTNCGTVVWSGIDLDCTSVQVYNYGLWDAQSDNTFNGNFGNSPYLSTFYNSGTVRKDGGSATTTFDGNTTFTNSGTVDVEASQISLGAGYGGGVFNTASNTYLWLGNPGSFNLSGNVTFTGPGLVTGNLYGVYPGGVIQGSLNFYSGSLGGFLTVATNAVANLTASLYSSQAVDLVSLTLTNCGTVDWRGIDLDCTGAQIYNYGLWDAQSDNTFYGNSGDSPYLSTFYNSGTVRKDGGSGSTTTFDGSTTFNNQGKTDVQKGQVTLAGTCSLTNGTLNFGICGPSQFGSIDFPNNVQLAGRLSVNLKNHYTPAVSNSFPVVVYGAETGTFSSLSLPPLSPRLGWQTNITSTAFTLSVVTAPALQLSSGLSVKGNSMSLSWEGLLGQTYQVQCATNLAPANWVDIGDPIIGTNGPIVVLDSLSASPNKYYRIQSQ